MKRLALLNMMAMSLGAATNHTPDIFEENYIPSPKQPKKRKSLGRLPDKRQKPKEKTSSLKKLLDQKGRK